MAEDPIEFTRNLGAKGQQRCGNRVQLEDENGNPINDANPLPVDTGGAGSMDVNARLIDENGVAYGVKHIENKPRVSNMPYTYDIVEGNVPNHATTIVVASIAGAGATWTDMWGNTGASVFAPTLSAAIAMEAVSSSGNDVAGGTGISKIEVHYLDANGDAQDTTIQLTGGVPVPLPENVLHINTVHCMEPGATSTVPHQAAGNIDIRAVVGGTIYARIPAGQTNAPRFVFRVPRNSTGYLVDILAFVLALANNSDALLRIVANQDFESGDILEDGLWTVYYEIGGGATGTVSSSHLSNPLRFNAGAVVRCQVIRQSGSGNADGSITAIGWIE